MIQAQNFIKSISPHNRGWFPSVFRAGFQAERPDSNLFLEQWIPFDMTNMATDDPTALDVYIDFKNGRSGLEKSPFRLVGL